MVDLHSHVLHGVDDGPADIQGAVDICKAAAADGVEILVATPHTLTDGRIIHPKEVLNRKVEEIHAHPELQKAALRIVVGAEIRMCPELARRYREGVLPGINGSKYLLFEPAFQGIDEETKAFLKELMSEGHFPVFAHPERLPWFRDNLHVLRELVEEGALVQITASSLFGVFGSQAKHFAEDLLAARLVHVLASDAHGMGFRPPGLSKAVERAALILDDPGEALQMVTSTPRKIIEDSPRSEISLPAPMDVKRSSGMLGFIRSILSSGR
jgi:protein-tyrosine phosphatase